MNLSASFEKETRESASNSSGFWGKLERGGAGEWFGDSILAIIASNLCCQRCLKVEPSDQIDRSDPYSTALRLKSGKPR